MMATEINILGIETSCDETAAAVVTDGRIVKSSVVASQHDLHDRYGGVVPEIASRAHIERIYPVLAKTMNDAALRPEDLAAIAVANRPGLTVALMVGVTAAKTLAMVWDKPLIAVNHVHAHLQAALLSQPEPLLPAVALIVSGGHSNLYACRSAVDLRLLGRTMDDAAGEAFDKVASILNLPYPGGPSIEKAARSGNPKAIDFPRSLLGPDSLDFSFSGLKTAVLYHCRGQDMKGESRVSSMSPQEIADIAASFQAAVVEVLVTKTMRAADRIGARTVVLGGGVAANTALREAMQKACNESGLILLVAPKPLCTDNAVMVASLAYPLFQAGRFADLSLEPASSAE
ncbi:MAG: tRNA (adenosine(37)-N6)-threonylcarbamoyltransferase complex transferase subunit TsaD [Phycisphaerae bacterium]|nr:tRNA (adenosine(37)-N6)-threonylcarbamoyltransferase complex transferase subunit TsaD [Phycisphaerae bacterium]